MIDITSALEKKAKDGDNLNEKVTLVQELYKQYTLVKPMIEAELVKAKKISNAFITS